MRQRAISTGTLVVLVLTSCEPREPGPPPAPAEPPALTHAEAFDRAMTGALEPYLEVQQALAADSMEGVPEAARRVGGALRAVASSPAMEGLGGWAADEVRAAVPTAIAAAAELARAPDLAGAREAFRTLSKALITWAKHRRPGGMEMVWCPMMRGGWIQRAGPVRNPYHGLSMLECGEKID